MNGETCRDVDIDGDISGDRQRLDRGGDCVSKVELLRQDDVLPGVRVCVERDRRGPARENTPLKHVNETTAIFAAGTVVGSGGTVSATSQAIDWSPTYEPEGRLVVNVGATPSGTLIARFLGGTAADNATVLGYGTATGLLAGTVTFGVDA